ncbi:MAG: hypothetical protein AAF687_03935 [Pseudomonadota bacterium]
MKSSIVLAAIATSAMAHAAAAQDVPSNDQRTTETDIIVQGGANRTDVLLKGVDFTLNIDDDEAKSTFVVGGFSSNQFADRNAAQSKRDTAWSLGLTVPVGGGNDLFDENIFDTLTDGIALSANVSTFWFSSAADALNDGRGPFRSRIMPEAIERCRAVETETSKCDQLPNPQFARRYLNDNRVNRSLFSTMWRLGADAEIELNRFATLDPTTLAQSEETKPGFSAGIYGAAYPSDAKSAFVLRAGYENTFEADDPAVVCKDTVVDVDQDCALGVADAPTNAERLNLSFEYRQAFEIGSGSTALALAPKFEVDALGGEWTASVPIYLLLDSDLPFTPGLSMNYDSEDDEVDVGIFLRATFGLN